MKRIVIDASDFGTLEEFFYAFERAALPPGVRWGRNLAAFDDVLCGGFGTPSEGFLFEWRGAELSKERLGYDETVRQLRRRLSKCHPSNRSRVSDQLEAALRREGPTVFDWLTEIIADHGEGGEQAGDNVVLRLVSR